jgi:hypothetical protein
LIHYLLLWIHNLYLWHSLCINVLFPSFFRVPGPPQSLRATLAVSVRYSTATFSELEFILLGHVVRISIRITLGHVVLPHRCYISPQPQASVQHTSYARNQDVDSSVVRDYLVYSKTDWSDELRGS